MTNPRDIRILRDLAKRYLEIASKPIQDERRELWRQHNSLVRTRPLVYMRAFACWNEMPESKPQCEDPFFQHHERQLRMGIWQDSFGDDYIIEPWITQRAALVVPVNGWGLKFGRIPSPDKGGSWLFDPPIKELGDIEKMQEAHHVTNEDATAGSYERIQDAVGDIVEINLDRSPYYQGGSGDISNNLAYLRGLEQVMWDMADNPEWLHRLCKHMSDGVVRAQDEAEAAGDWGLANHQNQAMPYAQELQDPKANCRGVKRSELWCFMLAQEMAQVSPAMHDEFVLQYQMPIMEKFGLVAYGCCEDLTHKIDMLRQIPNLRRIAVTPVADVARCAEQIGQDYVFSYRPNPAEMICCGFDPGHVRRVIRDALDKARGCHVDITLKDVQTVQGHPENLRRWTEVVRGVVDECA